MSAVNINIPGYPEAKAKGTVMIVNINKVPYFVKTAFDPESGKPVPQEPVHITAEQIQAIREQAVKDSAAVLAGCDAMLADIASASELKELVQK